MIMKLEVRNQFLYLIFYKKGLNLEDKKIFSLKK